MNRSWALFQSILARPGLLLAIGLACLPVYSVFVYIDTYGIQLPVGDQWLSNTENGTLDIVFHAANGTLELRQLTNYLVGHRLVFTQASTAVATILTDWNPRAELWLSFVLAIGRLVLLYLIFHALYPELSPIALVPFAFLVFSAYQYLLWLSGIYSVWHFASFFSLLAIWFLTAFPVGWPTLILATLATVGAAFSQGFGALTFVILFITLWMFGYRHLKYYAFWVMAAAIVLAVYFSEAQVQEAGTFDPDDNLYQTILNFNNLVQFPLVFRFMFAFLGNIFAYDLDMETPIPLGFLALALVLVNLGYIFYHRRNWRELAPWVTLLGMGSSLGVVVLVSRYSEGQFIFAIEQRYTLGASNFWLALAALLVVAVSMAWPKRRYTAHSMVLLCNMVLALVFAGGYLHANIWNWQQTAFRYGSDIGNPFFEIEQCLLRYPLYRDAECYNTSVPVFNAEEDDIYRLAYYGLAIYRHQAKTFVLPEAYQPDDRVLLDTPNPWMNAYLREWYLAGIDDAQLFHVAPPAEKHAIHTLAEPLTNLVPSYGGDTAQQLARFLGEAQTMWYIRTPETQPNEPAMNAILQDLGYLPTVYPLGAVPYNAELVFVRYEQPRGLLDDPQPLDETFRLEGWHLTHEQPAAACGITTLQTWWAASQTPAAQMGLRWDMRDAQGEVIWRDERGLTPVPSVFWQPDTLYLDERAVTIPCAGAADWEHALSIYTDGGGQFSATVILTD
ncbi:MAG: hypothetical protein ACLFTK_14000 [Anaerolineales bacterium]